MPPPLPDPDPRPPLPDEERSSSPLPPEEVVLALQVADVEVVTTAALPEEEVAPPLLSEPEPEEPLF